MLWKLKRRLGTAATQASDTLLEDMLEDARRYCMAYTGRRVLPPGLLEGVIVELAATAFNHRGMEGETSHSEGEVRMTIEGLPPHIRTVLDSLRLGKAGS